MIESGVGFVGEPPVLALDRDGKLDEQTLANLSLFLKNVAAALNGGLRLGPEGPPLFSGVDLPSGVKAASGQRAGNLSGQIIQFYFAAGATTYDIPHSLGRKPLGFIPLSVSGGAVISPAPGMMAQWSDTALQLVSTAATYAVLLVV
jgi:hypothetical protein